MPDLVATPTEEKINVFERRRPILTMGPHTIADWVEFERTTNKKHELRRGEFVEMSGGTSEHSDIIVNLIVAIDSQLAEIGCRVKGSEQKVYIRNKEGCYPDVTVVCGQLQIDFEEALRNPIAIFEVLSNSTEAWDRGEKFENYRTIESLRHYVLVNQYRPLVEHHAVNESGLWTLVGEHKDLSDSLTLELNGKSVSLPLEKIYRYISFELPDDVNTEKAQQPQKRKRSRKTGGG